MRKLIVMAFAVTLGVFVFASGQRAAHADAATAIKGVTQGEVSSANQITPVYWRGHGWHGGWRGRGWGPGWGWGPGFGIGYGWGGPYYGPYCRWHCGPYRCWRSCW